MSLKAPEQLPNSPKRVLIAPGVVELGKALPTVEHSLEYFILGEAFLLLVRPVHFTHR